MKSSKIRSLAPHPMSSGSDLNYCIQKLLKDEVNYVSKKELKTFRKENFKKLMQRDTVHVAIFEKKIKGKKDEDSKPKFEEMVRVYYPHRNSNKNLVKRDLKIETKIIYLNSKHFYLLKPM